jgi:plasmid maintenance system antidote protein VapI
MPIRYEEQELLIHIVRKALEDNEWSVTALSKKAELSQPYVYSVLGGRESVSSNAAIKILKAIDPKEVNQHPLSGENPDDLSKLILSIANRIKVPGEYPSPKVPDIGRDFSPKEIRNLTILIRSHMEKYGISKYRLSKRLGVNSDIVYLFLSNRRSVSERFVLKVLECLGMNEANTFHSIGRVPKLWQSFITKEELLRIKERYEKGNTGSRD